MRIYAPFLKAVRSSPVPSASTTTTTTTTTSVSTAWLSTLKAAQLQHVAFVTGESAAGTKPVLLERLSRMLENDASSHGLHGGSGNGILSSPKSRLASSGREMSILSIDMGIRNLAYAHLLVSPSGGLGSTEKKKKRKKGEEGGIDVQLNAWNRLAISSFPVEEAGDPGVGLAFALVKFNGGITTTTTTGSTTKKSKRKSTRKLSSPEETATTDEEPVTSEPVTEKVSKEIEKESFAPHIYALHAYNLITSLISAYKPTHVLIERQRFRSGGGSSVLEWTIRVGVFEGMLYTVLQTLRAESRKRRLKGADVGDETGIEDISVLGVDPQRVARYWAEKVKGTDLKETETKKSKSTAKEGKKAKIDVIGSLLSTVDGTGRSNGVVASEPPVYVCLDGRAQAREIASAFLEKWNRSNGRRKKGSSSVPVDGSEDGPVESPTGTKKKTKKTKKTEKGGEGEAKEEVKTIDIGKLDDLADCFLQGLTWLSWRDMRAKIAKGGRDAVPFE